ncbi:MAG: hypothetical protein P8P74_13545 [Crocinitomicaceae bacterium]|nr:hypothetical protein [Crocinitomicaceae bacterium]
MKSRFSHLLSLLLLSGFIVVAYASGSRDNSRMNRRNRVPTEKSIQDNTNLSDKEKEEMLAKHKAKIAKDRETNTVLATVLAEEYESNEVSADAKYKNRVFFVDGVIEDISKDLLDKIYISLEGYDIFGSVTCYVDDEDAVMDLGKGDRVVIRGRCDGTLLGVNMEDCEIIEVMDNDDETDATEEDEEI